jgi:hypothetical protein
MELTPRHAALYNMRPGTENTLSKEHTMKPTAAHLTRWAGLSAVLGGSLFIAIQAIHPPETLAAVTTSAWANVHYLGLAMCLLTLVGITGIYARQVEEAGWLGLAGFVLLGLMWALTAAFQFAEGFILPPLAAEAPGFAEGFVGISAGAVSAVSLGLLPTVFSLNGVLYLLGGVLLGSATFRAGILPRWAGGLLAIGTVAPLALAVLPHEFVRLAAVPMGIALVWLGYAHWSERPEHAKTAQRRAWGGGGQDPRPADGGAR